MTFLAVVSYGAVIVPILPDFIPSDVERIINHSGSKMFFGAKSILNTINLENTPELIGVYNLEDFSLLFNRNEKVEEVEKNIEELFDKKFGTNFNQDTFKLRKVANDELVEISYTSGTTGNSKGVMLLHNSLAANVRFARKHLPLPKGSSVVSFLPLAHAYGLAFEFLFPFSLGSHIIFLTKTPTPAVITAAFEEVKPKLILSVPLVIEKIYKKKIIPQIDKNPVKTLLKIPGLNKIIGKKVREGIRNGFGGEFIEIIVGGAALSEEIERFFKKIGLEFTIGYGMTECGPLISYSSWKDMRVGSCGTPVDTLEVKIDSEDPQNKVGEILVRGENVMVGYYKNEEATKQAIDEDGWLHTGDLGVMDKDGFIYIKGRSKSMILGPSGQNIYPEEIESIINNKAYVGSSLVKLEGNKLVALIYPDPDKMIEKKLSQEELEARLEHYRVLVNEQLPKYMQVSKFEIHEEDFAKTPKQSIKRYLYQD
jgi:long-chain acyl-CoA synthetase